MSSADAAAEHPCYSCPTNERLAAHMKLEAEFVRRGCEHFFSCQLLLFTTQSLGMSPHLAALRSREVRRDFSSRVRPLHRRGSAGRSTSTRTRIRWLEQEAREPRPGACVMLLGTDWRVSLAYLRWCNNVRIARKHQQVQSQQQGTSFERTSPRPEWW